MTTTVITPCTNARDYITCKLCRRARPTFSERRDMARLQPETWRPTAYGQCAGLLPREEQP
jgi:hypothetical protein